MERVNKWFQKAMGRSKFTLSGWKKNQKASVRRKIALSSRPKSWSIKKRFLSVSRALQSLANVTKDKTTKKIAKQDSGYFMKKYRQLNEGKK